MNDQQVREEAAFKIRFADIVSGKPGFDHEDDPSADVKIDSEAVDCHGQGAGRAEGAHGDLLQGGGTLRTAPAIPAFTSSRSSTSTGAIGHGVAGRRVGRAEQWAVCGNLGCGG